MIDQEAVGIADVPYCGSRSTSLTRVQAHIYEVGEMAIILVELEVPHRRDSFRILRLLVLENPRFSL